MHKMSGPDAHGRYTQFRAAANVGAFGLTLRAWRPLRRNTLRGFASITLPEGLEIDEVAVHVLADRSWANLPNRPMTDGAGHRLRDERGKVRYTALIRWADRDLASSFSSRIVELVAALYPTDLAR